MKILIIGDLHYKKMMYPPTVSSLSYILESAPECDLVIHTGDFCNDYPHSPELFSRLRGDGRDTFGVYGNHELETAGTSMRAVTPLITTVPEKVTFGTVDGGMGDGSIGYYYHDREGYRFIFLDTNYSLTADGEWEHNREGSWGSPSENTRHESLGTVQLEWMKRVIFDAADRGLRCITVSHSTFNKDVGVESPDGEHVREIFRMANERRAGSVVLAINGHYHTSSAKEREGVHYLNCPAAINGYWTSRKFHPYAEEDESSPRYTFEYENYDEEGNLTEVRALSYSALRMGAQTLFYRDPVYTVLTIDGESVSYKTSDIEWAYGIAPNGSV